MWAECSELLAEVSGKPGRHEARSREELPAIGDCVLANARPSEGHATIHGVLRKKGKLSPKVAGEATEEQIVAANVDTLLIVSAMNSVRRIERYRTRACGKGERGRHTTTARQLIRLPQGAFILNAPEMRELQLWDGASAAKRPLISGVNPVLRLEPFSSLRLFPLLHNRPSC